MLLFVASRQIIAVSSLSTQIKLPRKSANWTHLSSESKCHFHCVIFSVFFGHSLCTIEEEFYYLQGCSAGLSRKMTLVFPCLAVYATYGEVSSSHGYRGRFPENSLVLVKDPTQKSHSENDLQDH